MSDVTLQINGRSYQLACEDGQEDHYTFEGAWYWEEGEEKAKEVVG